MTDIIKEIIKGSGEKLRTPQVPGLIAIILLISRVIFSVEFKNLIMTFVNGLGKFTFLTNFFQLATMMLLITSLIAFIASIFNTISYIIISETTSKRKNISKNLLEHSTTLHRFFLGSKIALININIWLLVASSYFYIFDESSFNIDTRYILKYILNANSLIKVIATIYILTIFTSLLRLLERMVYKFLYFRLDEETEKKLYEFRDKYSV